VLCIEHLFLCPLGSLALLPADLLGPVFFGLYDAFLQFLDAVEEQTPCQEAVHRLRALPLAFDGEPRGDVHELHAARGLVDLLTPRPEERTKVSLKSLSATPRFAILSKRALSFSVETVNRDMGKESGYRV